MSTNVPVLPVKTVNPRIVPMSLEDKSTHRNVPCPVDLSALQKELTAKGGLIPPGYGEMSGKPMFIIVWGQEHTAYLLGRRRLMFPESKIDARHRTNQYAVRPEVYARALEWLTAEHERRKNAFLTLNFAEFQKFPDVAAYLEKAESSLDYMKLPADAEGARIAAMLPAGWRYVRGLYDYDEIGQQVFFVLQWMPPAFFGNESAWASLRFAQTYFPETDREEFIDICGDFPRHGRYEHIALRIGTRHENDFFNYKEPTYDNVIVPLQALLRITRNMTESQKTAEAQSRAAFQRERAKQIAETQRFREDFRQRYNDAKPVGKGAPTSISANKNKVR